MKKNKLHAFLAGAVASVSAVLIVVSVLISSGAAGMDSLFSETESREPVPLYELEKDSFNIAGDLGDLKIEDIGISLFEKRMDVRLAVLTVRLGVRVERIRYEIIENQSTFFGIACDSGDLLEQASEQGIHSFSFSVWQNFASGPESSGKIRIYIDYVNMTDGTGEIHTAVAEVVY